MRESWRLRGGSRPKELGEQWRAGGQLVRSHTLTRLPWRRSVVGPWPAPLCPIRVGTNLKRSEDASPRSLLSFPIHGICSCSSNGLNRKPGVHQNWMEGGGLIFPTLSRPDGLRKSVAESQ